MKLAKEFGRADWRNFVDGLTRRQLFEWLAFFELEGFTEERADMRFAHVFATLLTKFTGQDANTRDFLYMDEVYSEAGSNHDGTQGPTVEATMLNMRKAMGG